MEVLGGVASIITLIEATGVLAEVSRNLVLRWRNAPHEIQALATRLSLLAAELQSIKNATARSHPVLTDAIIRQSLSDLLTDVRKRLAKLESLHFRLEQYGPMRQKLQWTVKDAGSVEKMLSKTQEVEQRLANLMTLISLRAQTPILDGLDRIEQMLSTLVIALPCPAPVASATASASATAVSTGSHTGSGSTARRCLVKYPWRLHDSWAPWGLRGSLVTTKTGPHTDYDISFSISLPLARILGSYAMTGCLSLRSMPLYQTALTFRHPSYFAVARVVSDEHPFMLACWDGDIEAVRLMLRSGEGRPTDMTADGCTAVYYALRPENTEVLAELLDCGVEVDAIVDYRDTTTALDNASYSRDLDFVRVLLQRGASTDHISSDRNTASTMCWRGADDTSGSSCLDVFKLLTESTYFDLDDAKSGTHTVLQAAATSSTGFQIDQLIEIGVDASCGIGVNDPINLAALFGNHSTYCALALHHGETAFRANISYLLQAIIVGTTRWLTGMQTRYAYVRVWGQHDEIMMDVLQRGIDPRQWLEVSDWGEDELPSALLGKTMRANELAAALGPDTEAWYLSMMCICNLSKEEDFQRLRELSEAGHVTTGFVYGSEEESDGIDEDVSSESGESNEESECAEGDRAEDNDFNNGSTSGTASEADEDDEFWDAEELI